MVVLVEVVVAVRVCVFVICDMCGVGGCEYGKGTAEKRESRKGNEQKKKIMCPL